MIADLRFVFQNAFYRIAKRATEEAQEASAATTCSAAQASDSLVSSKDSIFFLNCSDRSSQEPMAALS